MWFLGSSGVDSLFGLRFDVEEACDGANENYEISLDFLQHLSHCFLLIYSPLKFPVFILNDDNQHQPRKVAHEVENVLHVDDCPKDIDCEFD